MSSLGCARDFACGLPLRSRPQTGSTFTAVTRVQIPAGDAKSFQQVRPNGRISCGYKKAQPPAFSMGRYALMISVFKGRTSVFLGTKGHDTSLGARQHPSWVQEPNYLALRLAFLTKEGLNASVQRHSAGCVTKQFLHHLGIGAISFQQGCVGVRAGILGPPNHSCP